MKNKKIIGTDVDGISHPFLQNGETMMIVTITMNPAIDKTIYLEELIPGVTNRSTGVEIDYGGKGINVAKVLNKLGMQCLAMGLMPSEGSEQMFRCLEELGIAHRFCTIKGGLRTNIKLVEKGGRLTEVNETGCVVCEDELNDLEQEIAKLEKATIVLNGSVPTGVPKDYYAHIIDRVKENGNQVLLDADGELLYFALKKRPDILKINEAEFCKLAETFAEYRDKTEGQICEELLDTGIKEIILTRGGKGTTYYSREMRMEIPAIEVKVSSTVGAGDTFGAAYLYAKSIGKETKEALYYANAAAAAAVETAGTKAPRKQRIEELFEESYS